ncbi:hypothetical protein H5410_020001 [Solanum commersonii]|uniref:Uncharacterized protein n=1 Tax=Solanum commersonii TaxID=4109 RepID=A0A9J5Z9X4_SOLCO|nr:hypothetical protein H5410_020001 [Solanum commersonii]
MVTLIVIITTRKADAAERADDRGFIHKLRFLSQEESWDLFCRKLLDVRAMVPAMKSLAKDMVEKCRGLPLAIVVLSGLLSHKKGLNEWQKVKDHLWKNIKEDKSIEISNILSLSYNNLSTVLKQCFLNFGIFPEDQVLEADNIIRLWMAEGFIPRGEERIEDVVEGFLNELRRRSLIQALEVNLFDIYDLRSHSISSLCIRHVIHSQRERYLSLDLSNLKLRSIMFFDPDFRNMSLINFGSVFQYLYVLYLDNRGGSIPIVPDAIGSLYHFKFLSLRGIHDVPSSIGNLKNLQTLVVNEGRYSCELPHEIADLINLRHLVARGVACDLWKDVNPVDLVNLRDLSMHHIMNSYSLNNISSLKNLSTLSLSCDIESFPSLEFVNCCEKLQKLWLEGRIEKLPHLFPNSIRMMVLLDSELMEDPMPILGMLPNLRDLQLRRAYEGKEIMCSDNNFSQLEFLHLDGLEKLETWHLGTSAMSLIKGLAIYDCPNLKEIPERMKDVELLTEDPMPILGMLPNLRNLQLFRAYEGKEIMCSDYSFNQLEFLNLDYLQNLEIWDLGTSAMSLIKGLAIYDCPNLKEIPERMTDLKLQKLGDFLIQQVSLRTNLRDEIRWLRTELLFIQSFLRDAELKQSGDHRVQQWVFEINSVANDAVAILETYSFEAGKGASRLKACACICRKEKNFYNVAKEIQSLKQRIIDISRRRETYGITNINNNAGEGPSNQVRTLRRTTSYVDEDHIFVGFQDVVQTLLAQLLKAEPRRNVLSIHGMGGLGKTTLARNLYNSPNIVSSFPTRAWICVSQEYYTMDLLKTIIKSIQGRTKGTLGLLETMTEGDLEVHLRDLLKERKYLVVVDDVWQKEAWESLKRAFPDSKNGSRVIITTRKEDVAERADKRGFVHKLRFLSQEESWDLFCWKLLDVRAMVPAMESLAKDMVEKCRGLPLAIVVLSGLLSHKKGLNEWQKVKDHLWKNIKEDKSIEISNILSLSYNDLSTALKQCFLYFGIFPEDQAVEADNIIWLWMAEGFIPRGEERMEDVAEGFLNELIRRSLVQVARTFWEKVTECRVHDLLHDLAIQKALEVNFFDIYDPKSHSISSLCIRHVIHSQGERYPSLDLSNLNLRSIMVFDLNFHMLRSIMFQHLYVLYLDMPVYSSSSVSVPYATGSLYHLKFLRLRRIWNVPSSIGNLKNLQTLVVDQGEYSCELPHETADLINLRHLVASYLKPLKRINKLTSLEVLKDVRCDQWKDIDPVDLVNLRELSMHQITKSYSLNNISSLKNLSTLTLFCEFDESFSSLDFLSSCQKLQKLLLKGRIEKLPLFPNSITMMVLRKSKLMEDPMPTLGMLPNLRDLMLEDAYNGKKIMCIDSSFRQLEFLHLYHLSNLERWHLATSAMPLIKSLAISRCSKLKEIPERMKYVEEKLNAVDL